MEKAKKRIEEFAEERNWRQFHTPENLAKSISIEAGELLECFQWSTDYDHTCVCEELADVMIYCLHMASVLEVDMETIILEKMDKNERKYPVDQAKGNCKKYTAFNK